MTFVVTKVLAADAAVAREHWLAGRPGWVLVWGVHGPEREKRRDGRGGTLCACKRRWDCPSPGKHPWTGAGKVVGGPEGRVVPLTLTEAARASWPGVRLAAWLSAGERVLDADSGTGLAALWRAWPEVVDSWLLVRTRRGLHCWQRTAECGETGGVAVRFRGGDIKNRGVVVWADGHNRRVVSRDSVAEWLTRLHGTEPGTGRIVRGQSPRSSEWEGGIDPSGITRIDASNLLRGAAEWLSHRPDGTRNVSLNWCGWTAGRRALAAGEQRKIVEGTLRNAARDCGLDEGEIAATLRSSLRGSDAGHPYAG